MAAVVRLAQGLALIVIVLALAEGDLEFGQTILVDEHAQGDNGFTGILGSLGELAQLALVEQELAIAQDIMIGITAELILGDMHLLGVELGADELAIGVSQAGFGLADRFDLRAEKLYAGCVALQDLVIERSATILDIYITF